MLSRDHALRCQALEGLQITAQAQGSTQVLSAEGKVDVATTALLAAAIDDAISHAPQIVVVDVSAVALFAAAGVSTLLDADEHARAAGCQLVVIAGEGSAHHVFERTDAQHRLTIRRRESRERAVAGTAPQRRRFSRLPTRSLARALAVRRWDAPTRLSAHWPADRRPLRDRLAVALAPAQVNWTGAAAST